MKNYEELKNKVESILKALDVKYDLLNINKDDDLTYCIQISTIGELKPLNSITCVLYFQEFDYSMNLLVGNIYKIAEDENIFPLYEIVNNANIHILYGKFVIFGDEAKEIIYRGVINCGKDFCELNESLVRYQLILFTTSLEEILKSLKQKGTKEEI